ncbi:MAG: 3-phosphoshikimate 1-carboxyvinyltransferase, partial [Boseongicola sp.]
TRSGIFETLREMGADLAYENQREVGGEPVADIRARYSPEMKGIEVPPDRAASMIDEYPILSVVASFAEGKTSMHGVKELRVKESDRIDAMAVGLRASGVEVEEGEDWWEVHGAGPGGVKGGVTVAACLDHRIAMSFLCLGMATREPMKVDDASPIQTSFPEFDQLMSSLGAQLVSGNR